MWFKASAPGSLMMLGEYAVLEGYPALVCAVDKRITVTLTPRTDRKIYLSSHLGALEISTTDIPIIQPFAFVLTTLKKYKKYFQQGFDLNIQSEFSNTIGFASSAAVTVATLAAVLSWLEIPYTSNQLLKMAREIIQKVQGVGSGADVSAAVYGGIVAYHPNDLYAEKLLNIYPITAIYSGSKMKTPQAICQVQQNFIGKQKEFNKIIQAIGDCAKQGAQAVIANSWVELGRIMNLQQSLMEALGVSTPMLNHIIEMLQTDSNILGSKISGSGFGDCAIGLGAFAEKARTVAMNELAEKAANKELTKNATYKELAQNATDKELAKPFYLPVEITTQGVMCKLENG